MKGAHKKRNERKLAKTKNKQDTPTKQGEVESILIYF